MQIYNSITNYITLYAYSWFAACNEKNITITCGCDATGLLQVVSIIRKESVQLTANDCVKY